MKACIDELNTLLEQYGEFFNSLKSLAYSALRKLNIDPNKWLGIARLTRTCKRPGGPCYLTVEINTRLSRRKVSLGNLRNFDNINDVFETLKKRYNITPEEIKALLLFKKQNEVRYLVDKIKYHAERVFEISSNLDLKQFSSRDIVGEEFNRCREVLVEVL